MASKKQIHRKSRIPGIESNNRICNKWNTKLITELLKDPLGLTPKKWNCPSRISMRIYNESLRKELGYDSINDLPEELRKWPHISDDIQNFKRTKPIKVDANYALLKSLGYTPKKTKLKHKVKQINKFVDHARGKERSLKREYERNRDNIHYKGGKNLLTSSVAFGKQVAKINLFIQINIKIIHYAERNQKGYYSYLQRTT